MSITQSPRFEDIDSKVKTALTKLYNALDHKSQALVSSQGVSKKRRGAGGGEGMLRTQDEDGEGLEEEEEVEEREDVGDVAAFIKAKKKADNAAKKPAKAPAAKKAPAKGGKK